MATHEDKITADMNFNVTDNSSKDKYNTVKHMLIIIMLCYNYVKLASADCKDHKEHQRLKKKKNKDHNQFQQICIPKITSFQNIC